MTYLWDSTHSFTPKVIIMPEITIPVKEKTAANLQMDCPLRERHVCPRRPSVRVLTRPRFETRSAIVLDVSANEIGLLLQDRLEPGTVLALFLQRGHLGSSNSRILSGRVLEATPQADGAWRIDCVLSSHLSNDELQALLQEEAN